MRDSQAPRRGLEHLRRQERNRGRALGSIVEPVRIGAHERDELLERVRRDLCRVDEQHARNCRHDRHGHELRRVVGELQVQAGIDHQRGGGRREQRVAVRLRARDGLRADSSGGPGPILHDDGLPPARRELLTDDARQRVGRPARGEWNDDPDRAARVSGRRILRPCGSGKEQTCEPRVLQRIHRVPPPPNRPDCHDRILFAKVSQEEVYDVHF